MWATRGLKHLIYKHLMLGYLSRISTGGNSADVIFFNIVLREVNDRTEMEFLSSRYRYIIDQGIARFLPRARTDQPDKISGCNIVRGNAAASANCARV